MGGVRHAIVQCYVKEPLFECFAACEVLKRERQSKSSCDDEASGATFSPYTDSIMHQFHTKPVTRTKIGAFIGKYAAPQPTAPHCTPPHQGGALDQQRPNFRSLLFTV